jgi:hypothetical protein
MELFPKFGDFRLFTIASQQTSHPADPARTGKSARGGRPSQFSPAFPALQYEMILSKLLVQNHCVTEA